MLRVESRVIVLLTSKVLLTRKQPSRGLLQHVAVINHHAVLCSLFPWMSSLFCEAPWPVRALPAGGRVSCLCYLCSYSWQQVLSLTFVGRVFSLCLPSPGGVQQAWLPCTWSPCMAYASVHYSPNAPPWCHCTSAGHWLCKLENRSD